MSEVIKILEYYSDDINNEIENALVDIGPKNLYEASIHLTKAGGKKIRPVLAILSSLVVGGTKENAIKTAAAIELIHTFSLIHDDIMDDDKIRRGQPSVHMQWGEPIAILAGDTLFSKAFETVLKSSADVDTYEQVTKALEVVVDSCIQICEGQAYDMNFEGNFDVSEDEYLDMIYQKTSALIAAATKGGAIVGGGNPQEIEALFEYGGLIGLAFQIQDDYLDAVSDESLIGKPVGSDIVEGKMTLMVVHTLEVAEDSDKEKLIEILKKENSNSSDVDVALNIFDKYGSIEYAQNLALENVSKAKELLNIFDDSEAKHSLELLADFVLERSS